MAQAQHGQIIATISMIPQILGSLRCHDGDVEREQREVKKRQREQHKSNRFRRAKEQFCCA